MTKGNQNPEIEKLISEIEKKNIEIRRYLDKIETLEDTIMDMEFNLSTESDQNQNIVLKNQIKHLEAYNRELKDKMGFLRLENIRLKKELDKSRKTYYDKLSLIKIVENDTITKDLVGSESSYSNLEGYDTQTSGDKSFSNIELSCPICQTVKTLKIPTNFINPSLDLTKISIPKDRICEHSFQIQIDKSFIVKKYLIEEYISNKFEFSKDTYFTEKIILQIQTLVDDREILGIAIFDDGWNIIFALIPSESIFDLSKEIQIRKEQHIRNMNKVYLEMKNQHKIFLEVIQIFNLDYILLLNFSQKVNFGMGTMLFKDVQEKLLKFVKFTK